MVTVYTMCLCYKYTTRFPHDMFRPDGAIFRYIGVYTISFFFLLLSPHWPAFSHIGSSWYIWSLFALFFVEYIINGISKILKH
jgi:hypothetical protein